VSEPLRAKRARRIVTVGFVVATAVAAQAAPTWLAMHDRDSTTASAFLNSAPIEPVSAPASVAASPLTSPTTMPTSSPPIVGAAQPTHEPSVPTSSSPGVRSAVTVKGSDAGKPADGGTASALATDTWSLLPVAPIAGRNDSAVAWTGTQMLIWGGVTGADDDQPMADGAAYDPASRTWSKLPNSPLTARTNPAAVWTGSELFVWGGDDAHDNSATAASDGALYNPATHAWRKLPTSPLSARTGAHALMMGGLVYVIGGHAASSQRDDTDAATYDPTTHQWQLLPAAPERSDQPTWYEIPAVLSGRLEVWRLWEQSTSRGQGSGLSFGIDAVTYDPAEHSWRTDAAAAAGEAVGSAVPVGMTTGLSTGSSVIAPAAQLWCGNCPAPFSTGTHGYVYAGGTWTPMAHGPVDDLSATYLWTGSALLAFDSTAYATGPGGVSLPGENAAWDPATGSWLKLPAAPLAGAGDIAAVWTGSQLLEWGPMIDPAAAGGSTVATAHDAGVAFGP
jgi:hypothetical protein